LRGFKSGHQVGAVDWSKTLDRRGRRLCLLFVVGCGRDCDTARAIPAGARDPDDREKEDH
jgi:hypothetical protein